MKVRITKVPDKKNESLNARKWKHRDGGLLRNYFYEGGPYGIVPFGGDFLEYLQSVPEVYGGSINPSVVTAALPAKFKGSQETARRYAEGYLKGSKPVSEAMNQAGVDIFNTAKNAAMFVPGPTGLITWGGQMGSDMANGQWGKVGRDVALAAAIGLGLGAAGRGIGYLRNYVDEATNFGEDVFRAMLENTPGKVSTNVAPELLNVGHATAPIEAVLADEASRVPSHDASGLEEYIRNQVAATRARVASSTGNALQDYPATESFNPGFWSNKALRLISEQGNAEAAVALASRPYEIENLGGGYMLKSLMRGNPLEKQLSKTGTVNVNNVRAIANKGSKVEQAVIDKVLSSEEFAGKKSIDYNKFRKAVQDELITYERTPEARWSEYGMQRLGVSPIDSELESDYEYYELFDKFIKNKGYKPVNNYAGINDVVYETPDGKYITEKELEKIFQNSFRVSPETYTFSSPRIPHGNAKHYNSNTLGHSRTYTTADEPDVLHVMESQSDWAQGRDGVYKKLRDKHNANEIEQIKSREDNIAHDNEKIKELEDKIDEIAEALDTGYYRDGSEVNVYDMDELRSKIESMEEDIDFYRAEASYDAEQIAKAKNAGYESVTEDYLTDNFTSRQIQENLRYAAEKGQKKMRYPTRETAAKIEGYSKQTKYYTKNGIEIQDPYRYPDDVAKQIESLQNEIDEIDRIDLNTYAPFTIRGDAFRTRDLNEDSTSKLLAALRERIIRDKDSLEAMRRYGDDNDMVVERLKRNQALFDAQIAKFKEKYGHEPNLDEIMAKSRDARARRSIVKDKLKEVLNTERILSPDVTPKEVYSHEDILRKYTEFPKQFKKLYKNADVRTVTDPKGNTWYEVDVPEDYLKQEWAYEEGGSLVLPKRMMEKYSPDKLREAIKKLKG